jgi:hypothetical protein
MSGMFAHTLIFFEPLNPIGIISFSDGDPQKPIQKATGSILTIG